MKNALALIAILFCSTALAQTTEPTTQPTLSAADQTLGTGKVVGLDEFFNHQIRNGQPFHYIWEDTTINGYSKFGDVWKQFGASITSVQEAPTRSDLDRVSIYIICNPTPSFSKYAPPGGPNYIDALSIDTIADWVNNGGILCLFANDKNNCEFEHLNNLASRFGITYNGDLRNAVPNARDRSPGTFKAAQYPDVPFLKDVPMVYMKEISTIQVKGPAQSIMTVDNEQGTGKDIIMATSNYGKGFVFAVGDPWFYNEYIDVTSTPGLTLENRQAAVNFCRWILSMTPGAAGK